MAQVVSAIGLLPLSHKFKPRVMTSNGYHLQILMMTLISFSGLGRLCPMQSNLGTNKKFDQHTIKNCREGGNENVFPIYGTKRETWKTRLSFD